jgi:hypothetical protein
MANPLRTQRPVRIWAIIANTEKVIINDLMNINAIMNRKEKQTSQRKINDSQHRLLARPPSKHLPQPARNAHIHQLLFSQ